LEVGLLIRRDRERDPEKDRKGQEKKKGTDRIEKDRKGCLRYHCYGRFSDIFSKKRFQMLSSSSLTDVDGIFVGRSILMSLFKKILTGSILAGLLDL
jgi:hypothetical protein